MILRILFGLLGAFAYYAAFFMYEDEEGHWQNRIERLWVGISDRASLVGSKSAAFFGRVAGVVTEGFNRLFGNRLLSPRMIGASTAYSWAIVLALVCLFELPGPEATINGGSI